MLAGLWTVDLAGLHFSMWICSDLLHMGSSWIPGWRGSCYLGHVLLSVSHQNARVHSPTLQAHVKSLLVLDLLTSHWTKKLLRLSLKSRSGQVHSIHHEARANHMNICKKYVFPKEKGGKEWVFLNHHLKYPQEVAAILRVHIKAEDEVEYKIEFSIRILIWGRIQKWILKVHTKAEDEVEDSRCPSNRCLSAVWTGGRHQESQAPGAGPRPLGFWDMGSVLPIWNWSPGTERNQSPHITW